MLFQKKKDQNSYSLPDGVLLKAEDLRVNIRTDGAVLNAVRGIDLELKSCETLGLVGESGCGKSVTSKEVIGINPSNCSSTGSILFKRKDGTVLDLLGLERDGALYRAIRGNEIAMIFQEPMTAFSPLYTIGSQMSEIILIHHPEATKQSAREKVIEMMKLVGIANPEIRFNQYPHEFSGGMLQRALIAMMLSNEPDLLIADEPTTALDVTIQAQILELMKRLQAKLGMSILFITHDLGIVSSMCQRVAVMYLGEIVELGSVRQIFHNPQHPYTRNLLRSLPRIDSSRDEKLYAIKGVVPVPVDLPEACGFHDRCEQCMKGICDKRFPPVIEIEPGHFVKCALHGKGGR